MLQLETILARQTPSATIESAYRAMLVLGNHRTAEHMVESMRSERADRAVIAARKVIDAIEAEENRPVADLSDDEVSEYVRQLSAFVFDQLREDMIEKGVDLTASNAAADETLARWRTLEPTT